jgi:hypothetical protein
VRNNSYDPPILTWLADPNGTVWAIDAANVMRMAPGAEPVKQVEWEELDSFIPADTIMAASSYFRWHLEPLLAVGRQALRSMFPWWYCITDRFSKARLSP